MAEKDQFGLFVEGMEGPAITSSDADLLQRLRTAAEFNNARTAVADAKTKDPSVLFPTRAVPDGGPAGLDIRKAEIRHQLQDEKLHEEMKSEVEAEPEPEEEEEEEEPEEDTSVPNAATAASEAGEPLPSSEPGSKDPTGEKAAAKDAKK